MRLGTYLGIFGTIFGNVLVSFLLIAVTGGPFYHLPASVVNTTMKRSNSASSSSRETSTSKFMATELNQSVISDSNCAVSGQFPPEVLDWCPLITYYASNHDLAPDLIAALILQESGGDPLAYSRSGAIGLMQVMPKDGLAAAFMCQNGPCFSNRPSTEELQDPEFNVAYGTRLLANLVKRHGDLREALKAYGPMDVGYSYADIVLGLYKRYGN